MQADNTLEKKPGNIYMQAVPVTLCTKLPKTIHVILLLVASCTSNGLQSRCLLSHKPARTVTDGLVAQDRPRHARPTTGCTYTQSRCRQAALAALALRVHACVPAGCPSGVA